MYYRLLGSYPKNLAEHAIGANAGLAVLTCNVKSEVICLVNECIGDEALIESGASTAYPARTTVQIMELFKVSMIAYGAVGCIPHLRELPFRDAALIVDEIVIKLDTEPWPVQIVLQDDVALGHHERLFNVAPPHGAALHIGRPSLHCLQRGHLMREEVRDRRGHVHRGGEAHHAFLRVRQHIGVEGLGKRGYRFELGDAAYVRDVRLQ